MPREWAEISVIMPAYRAAATIGRALASIAAQTVPPREVIVVDDGSDDGTFDAASAMIPDMNGTTLKVFRQNNQGPGAARNHALAQASCRYVAFLDADDEWLPAKIERSMAHLEEGGYTLVAHDGWVVRDGQSEALLCSRRFASGRDPFVELYRRGYIDTCSVVVLRETVMAAGGFDASLPVGQDFDLFLKILGKPGVPFLVFPEQLVLYHITPGSVTSNTARRLACQMRILQRHAPRLAAFPGAIRSSVIFRILAVHYEALTVFRSRQDTAGMLRTLVSLVISLIKWGLGPSPKPGGSPLRILINGLHAKTGGGVTYLRNMLPLLARDPELEVHLFLKREQLPLFSPIDARVRVRLFPFGGGLLRLLAWEQTVLPVLAWRMGADVTFSPANFGPLLAPGPVILLRNALAVADEETRLGKRVYWFGLSLMTTLSLLGCRRAIAVSEYARQALTRGLGRLARRRVTVIPHGLSPQFQPSHKAKEAPPFLLVVADIYVQKNLHTLVDALPKVRARHPAIRLLIAGREVDPDYAQSLRSRIAALGLVDAVVCLGSIEPEKLNDLYTGCTVFVFPSTVETFGNPLVEAMACGACIASSNTTAMPEILGDAGCLFNPADRDEIAAKLLTLLDDKALRADYGRRALERSARFSWKRTASDVTTVLKEAASMTRGVSISLWVWLVIVLGLYLLQFQSYVHALRMVLGLE